MEARDKNSSTEISHPSADQMFKTTAWKNQFREVLTEEKSFQCFSHTLPPLLRLKDHFNFLNLCAQDKVFLWTMPMFTKMNISSRQWMQLLKPLKKPSLPLLELLLLISWRRTAYFSLTEFFNKLLSHFVSLLLPFHPFVVPSLWSRQVREKPRGVSGHCSGS